MQWQLNAICNETIQNMPTKLKDIFVQYMRFELSFLCACIEFGFNIFLHLHLPWTPRNCNKTLPLILMRADFQLHSNHTKTEHTYRTLKNPWCIYYTESIIEHTYRTLKNSWCIYYTENTIGERERANLMCSRDVRPPQMRMRHHATKMSMRHLLTRINAHASPRNSKVGLHGRRIQRSRDSYISIP